LWCLFLKKKKTVNFILTDEITFYQNEGGIRRGKTKKHLQLWIRKSGTRFVFLIILQTNYIRKFYSQLFSTLSQTPGPNVTCATSRRCLIQMTFHTDHRQSGSGDCLAWGDSPSFSQSQRPACSSAGCSWTAQPVKVK
jgi:hypothetical protein